MGYQTLTFGFLSSGVLSWTAEEDFNLVGGTCSSTSNNVIVSTDPAQTFAGLQAATKLFRDVVYILGPAKTIEVKVPVIKGTTLFVRADGQAVATLFLEPISAEIIAT